jgi:glycine cleavage system H protein
MKVEKGLFYSTDHEWVKVDGDKAYVGLSDYAQEAMGDIVYVELPEVDEHFDAGDQCSVLESVKAAADIFMPFSGTISEVNEELEDAPEKINETPYEAHIFVIKDFDSSEIDELMDSEAYEAYCLEL